MKRFIFASFLILTLAGVAVAEGTRESREPYLDGEMTTLTGRLDLSGSRPVLQADGEEYLIILPRAYQLQEQASVADGSELTLEGYVHDAYSRFAVTEEQQVIRVSRAVIDGTEFEVETGGREERMARSGNTGRGGSKFQDFSRQSRQRNPRTR